MSKKENERPGMNNWPISSNTPKMISEKEKNKAVRRTEKDSMASADSQA